MKPRKAVQEMAPYHPPTGNRLDKMRLDFNENTVGCSPRLVEFLKRQITPERLAVYPDYHAVKETLAGYFGVAPDEFTLTNGTDEAIQVFINTYIDHGDEVLIPRPSYAMYRFYAEVAGATIREVEYPAPRMNFRQSSYSQTSLRPRARCAFRIRIIRRALGLGWMSSRGLLKLRGMRWCWSTKHTSSSAA